MFDGALPGQVDSVGVFIFLIANCFIWKRNRFGQRFRHGVDDDEIAKPYLRASIFSLYLAIPGIFWIDTSAKWRAVSVYRT